MQEVKDLKCLTDSSYFHYLSDLSKLNSNYQMNKFDKRGSEHSDGITYPPKSVNADDLIKDTLKIDQSSNLCATQSIQSYLMGTALWNTLNFEHFKQQFHSNSNEQLISNINSHNQKNMDIVEDFTNCNSKKRKMFDEHNPSYSFNQHHLNLDNANKLFFPTEQYASQQQAFNQYQSQQLISMNKHIESYLVGSNIENNTSVGDEQNLNSLSMQNNTDGNFNHQFICPVCNNEIKPEDIEDHFNYELKQMQNFTISLPTDDTTSNKHESPKNTQHKNDILNSNSRYAIFKKIERNRKERRDKMLLSGDATQLTTSNL
ncbi:unnamed protein product [Heterobilharzia americana]|nr:unnamed protein product [Heterobilharzia americana]